MTGLGDTTRGGKHLEAYGLASRGSGRASEFERIPPNKGRLVAAEGRSGRLFRETGPGKKI